MTVKDIIDRVLVRDGNTVLVLANGFEFELASDLAKGISSGAELEAEFCKNLVQKLFVNGNKIFCKTKEELLPEMEQLQKELTVEAEDERRMEINLESNRRLAKLLPLFKIRVAILTANDKSFMQLKDWRKELRIDEAVQNVYLAVKDARLWEKEKVISEQQIRQYYPDYGKLDWSTMMNVYAMSNALLEDCRHGIVPEEEENVLQHLYNSRIIKFPNVLGEEVRVSDIVAYKETSATEA